MQRSPYLFAYDVRNPRRLRQALAVARSVTTGGQHSVHKCFLTDSERATLLANYAELLDPSEDRLLLVRLDARAKTFAMGVAEPMADPDFFYVD